MRFALPDDISVTFHDLCKEFPTMRPEEIRDLKKSVREKGLADPIVLAEYDYGAGKAVILDGRHRWEAICQGPERSKANFIRFEHVSNGMSATDWVIAKNLERRHLSKSQKAVIIARRLEAQKVERGKQTALRNELAQKAGVSPSSVSTAKRLLKAAPEMAGRVQAGEVSLHKAKETVFPNSENRKPDQTLAEVRQKEANATTSKPPPGPVQIAEEPDDDEEVTTPAKTAPAKPSRPKVPEITIKRAEILCLIEMLEQSTHPDAAEAVESLWARIGGEE